MIIIWVGCKQSFRKSRWPWNAEPCGGKRERRAVVSRSLLSWLSAGTAPPDPPPNSPVLHLPFSTGTLCPAQCEILFSKNIVITSNMPSQSGDRLASTRWPQARTFHQIPDFVGEGWQKREVKWQFMLYQNCKSPAGTFSQSWIYYCLLSVLQTVAR